VTVIDMNAATLTTIRDRVNQCSYGHYDGVFLARCKRGDYGQGVYDALLEAEAEAADTLRERGRPAPVEPPHLDGEDWTTAGEVCEANMRIADRIVELVRAAENAAESVPA
jgi:hypothetical protein